MIDKGQIFNNCVDVIYELSLRDVFCADCGAAFSESSKMREHRRMVHKSRDYVCKVCGEAFLRMTDLKLHENERKCVPPDK